MMAGAGRAQLPHPRNPVGGADRLQKSFLGARTLADFLGGLPGRPVPEVAASPAQAAFSHLGRRVRKTVGEAGTIPAGDTYSYRVKHGKVGEMALSIQERGAAIKRARAALDHLAQNPKTTVEQLGQARWQLNNAYNANDKAYVYDAVEAIELIVLEVYGGVPEGKQD
jgi:hypothetical protein